MTEPLTWDEFERVDLRAGTIVEAAEFPEARRPAYRLRVDLGPELGVRTSSAQLTELYTPEALVGRRVLCVVNFPPRQIGPVRSEVLVTGVYRADGAVALATVDDLDVPDGARLG
ncbi:MAG: tRNA-binding protein [Thermoleophilia bacterium]|nr:tRNA-binding protein [Thermoleophilia bacterium]